MRNALQYSVKRSSLRCALGPLLLFRSGSASAAVGINMQGCRAASSSGHRRPNVSVDQKARANGTAYSRPDGRTVQGPHVKDMPRLANGPTNILDAATVPPSNSLALRGARVQYKRCVSVVIVSAHSLDEPSQNYSSGNYRVLSKRPPMTPRFLLPTVSYGRNSRAITYDRMRPRVWPL